MLLTFLKQHIVLNGFLDGFAATAALRRHQHIDFVYMLMKE